MAAVEMNTYDLYSWVNNFRFNILCVQWGCVVGRKLTPVNYACQMFSKFVLHWINEFMPYICQFGKFWFTSQRLNLFKARLSTGIYVPQLAESRERKRERVRVLTRGSVFRMTCCWNNICLQKSNHNQWPVALVQVYSRQCVIREWKDMAACGSWYGDE